MGTKTISLIIKASRTSSQCHVDDWASREGWWWCQHMIFPLCHSPSSSLPLPSGIHFSFIPLVSSLVQEVGGGGCFGPNDQVKSADPDNEGRVHTGGWPWPSVCWFVLSPDYFYFYFLLFWNVEKKNTYTHTQTQLGWSWRSLPKSSPVPRGALAVQELELMEKLKEDCVVILTWGGGGKYWQPDLLVPCCNMEFLLMMISTWESECVNNCIWKYNTIQFNSIEFLHWRIVTVEEDVALHKQNTHFVECSRHTQCKKEIHTVKPIRSVVKALCVLCYGNKRCVDDRWYRTKTGEWQYDNYLLFVFKKGQIVKLLWPTWQMCIQMPNSYKSHFCFIVLVNV